MATFFGPAGGPFDEYFARFFGPDAASGSRRVDITQLLTEQAQGLLAAAASFAHDRGQDDLDALHLLWATAKQEPTRSRLQQVGVDPEAFAKEVESHLPAGTGSTSEDAVTLTLAARTVLADAHRVARALGATYIGPQHVLFALAANPETEPGRLLGTAGAGPEALRDAEQRPQQQQQPTASRDSSTPTLDTYGRDLTELAREGKLDPVIGRADEIEQTVEILSRRTKNNPVLIGEAGVGKTAVVEGLAQRVTSGDVPSVLSGKRVVQLDLSGMLAGTRYRGDFEERMTKVIDEISEHRDELVVFIDEVHTVVGAGGAEGAMDAGNILKPRLARGELHVVGATTLDEYRKNIEKDPALERRFQPVQVPEPSVEDTVAILRGLREQYEQHHDVTYTEEAVQAAARLSDQYVNDRFLPDKAIDLIDQAGARKRLNSGVSDSKQLRERVERLEELKNEAVSQEDYERASALRDEIAQAQVKLGEEGAGSLEVTAEDIAEVISRATGIPVSRLTAEEKSRLRNLESELHQRVVGQDDAVRALARAVRRSRSGLGDPSKPVGSFLFLGPTGVGKTELAKALAESLFGDEQKMIRLDMSEFQERHTASRLVGAPPGYVGHGEAGELTEAVRRSPYSVVLLDEIEKAHPDVFNTLLQVLDDGRLTDGQGRTVDFSNTVVVMTSNLGSEVVSSAGGKIGFTAGSPTQDLEDRIMPKLKEAFRPEFLNRINEIVTFRRLDGEQLHTITRMLLRHTTNRLAELGIEVVFDDDAVAWIADRGYQPEFGARPLRRAIEREVDDRISDLILDGELAEGSRLRVSTAEGGLDLQVETPVAA